MNLKLAFALIAIGLSLYGRQAESMSPPVELPEPPVASSPGQPVASSSPEIPALKLPPGTMIDWVSRTIHAVGKGYGSESADLPSRRLLALRAARVDALRKLATVVYGMHIDPVTTIEDRLAPAATDEAHQKLRIKVEGLIRWAREAEEPLPLSDGGYMIHLVMPLSAVEATLSLAQPLPKQ